MPDSSTNAPGRLPDDLPTRLARATSRVLMLDYDGTLAPFRRERGEAVPYPGVREILADMLARGHSRLVIVSGRSVEDLLPLLGLDPAPEIWGSHGWERRSAEGEMRRWPLPRASASAIAEAWDRAKRDGLIERCERKPAGFALHWRGLSERDAAVMRAKAESLWRPLTGEGALMLHAFDGGLEVRVPGRDKGSVVDAILAEAPPGTFAAYLGDDRTDEDAFRALGDRGLAVLVRTEHRPTAAPIWLRPPDELMGFLRTWNESTEVKR